MNKLPFFSGKMPSALVLHNFMNICCQRRVPFRYDPSTKDFCAYPICSQDLDALRDYFRYISNRDQNPLQHALPVTNSNT